MTQVPAEAVEAAIEATDGIVAWNIAWQPAAKDYALAKKVIFSRGLEAAADIIRAQERDRLTALAPSPIDEWIMEQS
jgi:hypothetical protein